MTGAPGDGCCSIVATAGTVAQEQANTLASPNLPPLNAPAAELAAALPRCIAPVPSSIFARDHRTPPIYLLTGRLRR
jgi:hypothetical protein